MRFRCIYCNSTNKSVKMSVLAAYFLIFAFLYYKSYENCELLSDIPFRPFHKIKTCYRSNLPVIARSNALSINNCMNFAKERGGLAINFSPPGAKVSKYYQDNFFVNCLVLGCPETVNSTTFVNDTAFDYYSLYGDLDALMNTSCIRSVGMFRVYQEKLNYTSAIMKCQEIGGDLAHVVSDARTNGLSTLVNDELKDWYKIAYVGLDDTQRERHFETPLGEPLNCFKYRAWGPGQPRNKQKNDDCVVIDTESSWKVMNCLEQLSFVCELYPMSPPKLEIPKGLNCSEIEDPENIKKCLDLEDNSTKTENNVTSNDRCPF